MVLYSISNVLCLLMSTHWCTPVLLASGVSSSAELDLISSSVGLKWIINQANEVQKLTKVKFVTTATRIVVKQNLFLKLGD